jgi:serine/threonine-protein kinase
MRGGRLLRLGGDQGEGEAVVALAPHGLVQLCQVQLCQVKRMNAAAARFWAEAFAAEPKLAVDLNAAHRYKAACSAALAAAGKGKDADALPTGRRLALRRQALTWLRADLAAWSTALAGRPAVAAVVWQQMQHWQKDADLAGIRDKETLAKLPADEQQSFAQLWADVAELWKKAEQKRK